MACAFGFLKISPIWVLVYLSTINILIYIDRGALSAVVGKLEKSDNDGLGLSSIEAGALGSLFMLGYMLSSPIFAHSAQFAHPLFLMAVGLFMWIVAVLFAGFSRSFGTLAAARSITGIGEASFVCLAPPYILDSAPPERKTLWLAVFYSGVPVGYALGFIYGALVSNLLGAWYWPFIIEGLVMIPFVIIALIAYKDPAMMVKKKSPGLLADGGEAPEARISLGDQMKILFKTPVYVMTVLGYGAYAFTLGGLSYWGPDYINKYYDAGEAVASYSLGGITVGCGLFATVLGSWYMDKKTKPYTAKRERGEISEDELRAQKTEIGGKILVFVTGLGVIIGVLGAFIGIYYAFMLCLAGAEFFIFLGTGPVGMVLMSSVPPELRGQANAMAIFFMHLLGDFPSPFLIGVLFETIGRYWGMIIVLAWLAWASFFWGMAWTFARLRGNSVGYAIKHMFKGGKKSVKEEQLDFRDTETKA